MALQDKPRSRKLTVTPLVELREKTVATLLQVNTWGPDRQARAAITTATGVTLSRPSGYAETGPSGCTVLWHGPGSWLVHVGGEAPSLQNSDQCAVTNISDSRFLFNVSGIAARRFVASGCAIDVDSLQPGAVLLTRFDQFDVLLHCLQADSYDIFVERSYGDYFRDFAIRLAATMTVHVDATE